MADHTERKRLIVIGAGASGLMASARLTEIFDVTILEARERTGGRIHTIKNKFVFPVEAGAEFIHGDQPITHEILKRARIKTTPFEGRFYRFENGSEYQDDGAVDQHWDDLVKALSKLDADVPVGDFLQSHFPDEKYRDLRKNVKQFAEGYDAADLSRVSAFALREEWATQDDDDQERVVGGYAQIIGYLTQEVEKERGRIVFSAEVNTISWRSGKVTVTIADGRTFVAERLLVTVPLGVLQKDKLTFQPELVVQKQAWMKLGFGGVIKYLFQFDEDFWRRIQGRFPDFAFVFSDANIPTWWSQAPGRLPLLTGWLGGPRAAARSKSGQAGYDLAMKSLSYLLEESRETLEQVIVNWHIADWVNDPFSLGAYAYATVGSDEAIATLLQPVEDTIYFAGEALYQGVSMGTVEAALSSGRDAARRIAGQVNIPAE